MNCLKCRLIWALVVGASFLAASGRAPGAITVDGNLTDWGVAVATGGSGTPGTGASSYANLETAAWRALNLPEYIGHYREDTNDNSNSYEVGPNHGGQNYDAELLAVARQGNILYLAIMSGQRPQNGSNLYAPGDIAIFTTANKTYGIEVGGGFGGGQQGDNGAAAHADNVNQAPGTTYAVDANGNTVGARASGIANSSLTSAQYGTQTTKTADGPDSGTALDDRSIILHLSQQVAGSVWETIASDWILDPISSGTSPVQFSGHIGTQFQAAAAAQYEGQALFVHTRNQVGGPYYSEAGIVHEHSVIELALNLALFDGLVTQIRWSPTCGNDVVWTEHSGFGPEVPEPASLLVWTILGIGCVVFTKRRFARAI